MLKFWICLSCVVFWMLLIFLFSSQSGEDSGALSNKVAESVMSGSARAGSLVTGRISVVSKVSSVSTNKAANIKENRREKRKLHQRRLNISNKLRSLAHTVLYFFLALSFSIALYQYKCKSWKILAATLLFGIIYSLSDEWHQSFVPGRGFEFIDLQRDFFGTVAGAFVVFAFVKLKRLIIKK